MRKKHVNIILLVVVLGIWGAAIYKFITGYWSKDQYLENASAISGKVADLDGYILKDTFALEPLKRDPFLGKLTLRSGFVRTASRTAQKGAPPPIKPDQNMSWPELRYFGFVENQDRGSKLILLRINGKLYKIREGDYAENIRVLQAVSDSVAVLFNSEKRYIHR